MKYFIWRLLRRCFWIKLRSHWGHPKTGKHYYGEWEQRKDKIRKYNAYELLGKKQAYYNHG